MSSEFPLLGRAFCLSRGNPVKRLRHYDASNSVNHFARFSVPDGVIRKTLRSSRGNIHDIYDQGCSDLNALETFLRRNRVSYSKTITTKVFFEQPYFGSDISLPEIPAVCDVKK